MNIRVFIAIMLIRDFTNDTSFINLYYFLLLYYIIAISLSTMS